MFPLLSSVIRIILFPRYHFFMKKLDHPLKTQRKVLKEVLSPFFGISANLTIEEFQENFPIKSFEEYDESNIKLPKQQILFYELTSGSTTAKKKIPYTKELLKSFSRLFSLWVYDILKNGPRFKTGKLYFSITPQFTQEKEQETSLKDDSDYIQSPLKYLFNALSVTPAQLKYIRDPQIFFHVLCLYLIKETRLEIISIWSPTFLIQIYKYIEENKAILAKDLKQDIYNYKSLKFKLPKSNMAQLNKIIESSFSPQLLFPNLKFISCWGGAHAQSLLHELSKLCPQAFIQEKGLLSTEAPLSLPFFKVKGQIPLIDEVFFEFKENIPESKVKLLHELELNREYEIFISQKSGLLRYKMNDLIHVDATFGNTPTFHFIGRTNETCDLVGEKLNSHFVSSLFQKLSPNDYLLLLPVKEVNKRPFYLLLSERPQVLEHFERELSNNPHYNNAKCLKQLGGLESLIVPNLEKVITQYNFNHHKQSMGDQKKKVILYSETNGNLLSYLKAIPIQE